ncbi:MAG: GDSL-type esterase/lipase family protein [Myxococcales bacterium]|nr:GDSL-type esterase/lipase family protein [Myxococcales bacterium]MDH3484227.1 GDSL-type esterase/lipase family protein [Myxococcales bacterium]
MTKRTLTQPTPLQHLAIVTLFMLVACTLTYVVPPLHSLRPWIPSEEGIPIVRLFRRWGEIPAFAGHGGSYRATTTGSKSTARLAETVGETVAANLGASVVKPIQKATDGFKIDPDEYAGISVFIEDPSGRGMAPFYRALEKTAKEEAGAITRVGHYGDSSIATDLITSTVRGQLQRRFGDAGHGFVIAATGHIPYKHRGVRQSSNDDSWITREVARRQDRHGRYGYGGVQSRAQRGAWARVATAPRGELGTKASRFDIYYQEQPRGGTFAVRLDRGDWEEISTKAPELGDAVYSVDAPDGPHQIHVRYKKGGPVHFYGVVVERDGPGVVYDSLGLVGARANRLLNFEEAHIASQLKQRGTDLVVLGFGGNEASDDKPEHLFYEDYARVLAHVRQGREDLGCLVFAPLDQASRRRGRIRTLETIPRIVAAQRRAALEAGCAFYNTWEAMGGRDAMRRWYKAHPRLAMSDFRHATPAGYEIIGNMFYKALLAGFADYLADGSSPDPASAEAVDPISASESPETGIPSSNADSSTSPNR